MVGFVIRNFKGVAPRVAPRILADNQSQNATDVVLTSGALVALKQNVAVLQDDGVTPYSFDTAGEIQTIYRFGQDVPSAVQNAYWFNWDKPVNVVKGPVFDDFKERTYYSGDGYPKVTTSAIAHTGSNKAFPSSFYKLGVEPPSVSPYATVVADPGAIDYAYESRQYVLTYKTATDESEATYPLYIDVDAVLGGTPPVATGEFNPVEITGIPVPAEVVSTVLVSSDGETWKRTEGTIINTSWEATAFNDSGVGIAVSSGVNTFVTYVDISGNMTNVTIPGAAAKYRVAYGNGRWVLLNTSIASSSPGVTWSSIDGKNWNDGALPAYYAFSTTEVSTATFGKDGPAGAAYVGGTWKDIAFGGTGFVAIRNGTRFAFSVDGIAWTKVDTGLLNTGTGTTAKSLVQKVNGVSRVMKPCWNEIVHTGTGVGAQFIAVANDTNYNPLTGGSLPDNQCNAYVYSADGKNWNVGFLPVALSHTTSTSLGTNLLDLTTTYAAMVLGMRQLRVVGTDTVCMLTRQVTTSSATSTTPIANVEGFLQIYFKKATVTTVTKVASNATYNNFGYVTGSSSGSAVTTTTSVTTTGTAVPPALGTGLVPAILSNNKIHQFMQHGITGTYPVLPINNLVMINPGLVTIFLKNSLTYYTAPKASSNAMDTWVKRRIGSIATLEQDGTALAAGEIAVTSSDLPSTTNVTSMAVVNGTLYAMTDYVIASIVSKNLYRKVGDGVYKLVHVFTNLNTTSFTDSVSPLAIANAASPSTPSSKLETPAKGMSVASALVNYPITKTSESRVYVTTFVTNVGEESAPSNIDPSEYTSRIISVYPLQTVSLSNIATTPTGRLPNENEYGIDRTRIYRSVPGSQGTSYLLVAEIPATESTYHDTVLAEALGETLPTIGYDTPPANLKGLISLPNGILAGYVGREVYFSVPFKPYAWPSTYAVTTDFNIVGLGAFDTSVLVLTTGQPYLISGSDPTNMVMVASDIQQPCVSTLSIVNATGGVIFASPDGLIMIGGSGTKNLTDALFTQIEWRTFTPSSISGYLLDNKYVGFYDNDVKRAGFVLDLQDGTFTHLDWYASAGFYDSVRDALFLVTEGNALVKYAASDLNHTFTWKSKEFYYPKPVNMAVGHVEASTYPVTFKVYADKQLVATKEVVDTKYFKLPSGFLAQSWEIQVESSNSVYAMGIAQTTAELQNG